MTILPPKSKLLMPQDAQERPTVPEPTFWARRAAEIKKLAAMLTIKGHEPWSAMQHAAETVDKGFEDDAETKRYRKGNRK